MDFNQEAAKYLAAYIRISDEERETSDLTLNQLLGEAIYKELEDGAATEIDVFHADQNSLFPASSEEEDRLFGIERDPALANRYSHYTLEEYILEIFKQTGYQFNADYMISIGLETKRLDQWMREIDQTGELPHRPVEKIATPKIDYTLEKELGAGVVYSRFDAQELHSIDYFNPETDCHVSFDILKNEFFIAPESNEELEALLEKISLHPALRDSITETIFLDQSDPPESSPMVNLKRTANNTQPLMQLLQREGIMSRATAETFSRALKQYAPIKDKGV